MTTTEPEPSPPSPASTICLFRSGTRSVLMAQRGSTARFMASAWVFPGGTVDPIDHDPDVLDLVGVADPNDGPWVAAAVRELIEEVGIWLGPPPFVERRDDLLGEAIYAEASERGIGLGGRELALFANWITPRGLPIRFDTRFYLATIDADVLPDPDLREIDRAEWIEVEEAIRRGTRNEMIIPFPTMKTLEYLATFATGDVLVRHARSLAAVAAILPKMRLGGDGSMGIVLPTEAGYDDLAHLGTESRELLQAAARQAGDRGEPIPEAG